MDMGNITVVSMPPEMLASSSSVEFMAVNESSDDLMEKMSSLSGMLGFHRNILNSSILNHSFRSNAGDREFRSYLFLNRQIRN
jgi:hypothetical protein